MTTGKMSVAQIAQEVNGKKVRNLEAKSGSLAITFADGTQLWVVGLNPVMVEYGPEPEPELVTPPVKGK